MHLTAVLRQRLACRITLFTRQNCSLCADAKQVLSSVWDRKPFEYDEIDVMRSGQQKWKDVYEYDTPVIHFDKTREGNTKFQTTTEALKLMHRFKEDEVLSKMEEAMMKPST